MTTTVIVIPHGRNVEVERCHQVGDTTVSDVVKLDPWAETRFTVYDSHPLIVRETGGLV